MGSVHPPASSETTIRRTCKINGVLTDVTSMTIEVNRTDTGDVVIAAGTAMNHVSTGTYQITFPDSASYLTYSWTSIATINGNVKTDTGTAQGGMGIIPDDPDPYVEFTSLYDLLHDITPNAPSASPYYLQRLTRRVFGDFCQSSGAWEAELIITTVSGQRNYTLVPPSDTVVTNLISAIYTNTDTKVCLEMARDCKSVTMGYAPTSSGESITLTVLVMPTMSCTLIPTSIFNKYGFGIASGVIAYLKGESSRPWSDIQNYPLYDKRFRQAINQAKIDRFNKHQSQPTYPKLPAFF